MDNKLVPPLEWYTEQRKVKDLIPLSYNPRILTDEKRALLRKSLEKFNLAEIPAINLDNTIIAGHQRVKVLIDLDRGDDTIDVRIPNRLLSEAELKEYNITSNVPIGFWDTDILDSEFKDVDLEALGLFVDDIILPDDLRGTDLNTEEEEPFDIVLPKTPITNPGDVYEFKSLQKNIKHRLVCGDSTLAKNYNTLLQGKQFDLVATDPPYNVNYQGGTKAKLKIKNDNMKADDFYSFLYMFYQEAFINSAPGSAIYVFHADTEGMNFRKALTDVGFKLSQCLVWVKNALVMGRNDYHWQHEPILYGWKTGAAHNWYSDRKQKTVLEFDKPLRNEDHPTMKPLDLVGYLVKNSSKQQNIVGDLFLGSGTTLIVCENTWRNCYAMEDDPVYVDVDVRRWLKYMRDNDLKYSIKKNGKLLSTAQQQEYFNNK